MQALQTHTTRSEATRDNSRHVRGARFRTAGRRALAAAAAAGVAALGLVLVPGVTLPADAASGNLGMCVNAGQVILPGQYLAPPTVTIGIDSFTPAQLIMQGDGNLVVYNSVHHALWDSQTWGHPGAYAVLQPADGNLVVYAPGPNGKALWTAAVANAPGDRLCMQKDRNLVVYAAGSGNTALWATMSGPVWPVGTHAAPANTYPSGQCTWWAADQAHNYTGAYPVHAGDAYTWATTFHANGWAIGNSPQIGSIAVFGREYPGASNSTDTWPGSPRSTPTRTPSWSPK